jgi:hypothetical protein
MTIQNPAGVPIAATRDQHQAKIKSFSNWIGAVSAGSFVGKDSLHIATLLNLLESEHAQALADFEAQSLTHPEWGTSVGAKLNKAAEASA